MVLCRQLSAMLLVPIQLLHCNEGLLHHTDLDMIQLDFCLSAYHHQIHCICASSFQQGLWWGCLRHCHADVAVAVAVTWQFCKNQDCSWRDCQSSVVGYSASLAAIFNQWHFVSLLAPDYDSTLSYLREFFHEFNFPLPLSRGLNFPMLCGDI